MHTHELPEGWSIVAAGNPATDEFFVSDLDRALMNRFCHIKYDIDYKSWTNHAKKIGMDGAVVDFVNTYRPFDKKKELEYNLQVIPTPRSIEMATKLLAFLPPKDKALKREALMGLVGLEVATQMLNHLDGNVQERILVSEILDYDTKVKDKLTKMITDGRLDTVDEALNALIEYTVQNKTKMKAPQIKKMFEFLGDVPADMAQRVALTPDFEQVFEIDKFTSNGGIELLKKLEGTQPKTDTTP